LNSKKKYFGLRMLSWLKKKLEKIPIEVLVLGNTGTGKSHFIMGLSMGFGTTLVSTRGYRCQKIIHGDRALSMTEIGGRVQLVVRDSTIKNPSFNLWGDLVPSDACKVKLQTAQCIYWFIDMDGEREDIFIWRSRILTLLRAAPNIPLCIVCNQCPPDDMTRIPLSDSFTLQDVLGLIELRSISINREVYVTELMYKDPDIVCRLFDWTIEKVDG
jgi:hypothetical protein